MWGALAGSTIGIASLYASAGFGARAAVAVMATFFGNNLAPGSAGPILYTDFIRTS